MTYHMVVISLQQFFHRITFINVEHIQHDAKWHLSLMLELKVNKVTVCTKKKCSVFDYFFGIVKKQYTSVTDSTYRYRIYIVDYRFRN